MKRLNFPFTIATLHDRYRSASISPVDVVHEVYDRINEDSRSDIWISLRSREDSLAIADQLSAEMIADFPLYGIPFSVKDNIDVFGLSTTAACPAFSYVPECSAHVVERLELAGAICIGKTNLDQFATGLNGTRSPYGECASAFHPEFVSGGSSSGSAVSVSLQHVCFSLGTDTGGSGRIPAGLNNVVGLKPTCRSLSSHGLVPCCPSIDCPSVFALSVADAVEVASLMFSDDHTDPSLRYDLAQCDFSIGERDDRQIIFVPDDKQLEFFENHEALTIYKEALELISESGLDVRPFDFAPFLEVGQMLFDGPFLADRYAAIGSFLETNQDSVLETTYSIVSKANQFSAVELFQAMKRIDEVKAFAQQFSRQNGLFVFPTVAPLCTISELLADPVRLNNQHGFYSYFANILDLCAMSIPCSFYKNGMPFGLTIMGSAFADSRVAALADALLNVFSIKPGKARS